MDYKPLGYNSVSCYLVVDGASRLMDLLNQIFGAAPLRKYESPEGKIMHAEMRIDDTVLMIADATESWPAISSVVHVYVQDADRIYQKAIAVGCEPVEAPRERDGDPDRRGGFKDFAGNFWSVSTQVKPE